MNRRTWFKPCVPAILYKFHHLNLLDQHYGLPVMVSLYVTIEDGGSVGKDVGHWSEGCEFKTFPSTTNLPLFGPSISGGWKLSLPHDRDDLWHWQVLMRFRKPCNNYGHGKIRKIQMDNEVISKRTLAWMWVNLYLPQLFCEASRTTSWATWVHYSVTGSRVGGLSVQHYTCWGAQPILH